MLKGKCKKDFERWYENLEDFYHLDIMPLNMVYGIYVDFFDSVGIRIYTEENNLNFNVAFSLYDGDIVKGIFEFKTRQEARTKAIEKANEIYNNGQNNS